jgi:hypothetical protein
MDLKKIEVYCPAGNKSSVPRPFVPPLRAAIEGAPEDELVAAAATGGRHLDKLQPFPGKKSTICRGRATSKG